MLVTYGKTRQTIDVTDIFLKNFIVKKQNGEFLLFIGIFQDNIFITIFAASSIVLSGVYSLWLFNRVSYGNLKVQYIRGFSDITKREFFLLLPLIFLTIFLGFYPEVLFNKIHLLNIYSTFS